MKSYLEDKPISRRQFLKLASVGLASSLLPVPLITETLEAATSDRLMHTRKIPSTGENLPVVGVGTWQQFDVPSSKSYLKPLRNVLRNLFRTGGSVIDTSPMYGRAETVIGRLLNDMKERDEAFLATKVWTRGRNSGIQQMESSMRKMNVNTIDLMQVHNLVDWDTHLTTLKKWKEEGRIRYTGVTHYTRSAFDSLEQVMRNHDIDFVQLPYSINFRDAEKTLLPLADERGIAVIVNRPFEAGRLFRRARGDSLPEWSRSLGCDTWAQFFLKFILGHEAVTCVIPGTSDPEHMLDNALAGTGHIPSSKERNRMVNYWQSV